MYNEGIQQWKGKVAVVTGASSGMGAAVAERLVIEGIKVVGLARRKERIDELAKKLEGKKGKLYAIKTDVTKENEVLAAFKWIQDHLGTIHILVNAAGIARNTTLVDGDTQKWKEIFDTNVIGLSVVTREALRNMRANKVDSGHIVNFNSLAGHRVPKNPNNNVYPASKYAVTALTETLRQDLILLGSNIKTTSISHGPTNTEFIKASGGAPPPVDVTMLEAADVADTVAYVLSTPPRVHIQEVMLRPIGYLP